MAGMKGVSYDDIARWIFEDSKVEGEFSDESELKKLFLYAVILVPVNLNLVMKKKVTIIRNL
jgi:hypothetical protein